LLSSSSSSSSSSSLSLTQRQSITQQTRYISWNCHWFVLSAKHACVSPRWSETSPGYWTGVLAGRVWTLTQSEEQLWYTLHDEEKEEGSREEDAICLENRSDYFQLHINLSALYQGWSYVDSHFREVAIKFPGR
uniref:8-oxoguanine DNA glycosylase N-terminal domain-containing protein n=1 Tax=Anolis carolinensis TaxID=28377 RepID=A0A803SVP3_ANOCA